MTNYNKNKKNKNNRKLATLALLNRLDSIVKNS